MDIKKRFENLLLNKRLLILNSAACLVLSLLLVQIFNLNIQAAELPIELPVRQEIVEVKHYGIPKKIAVPKINIEAPIEEVSTNEAGDMEVPDDPRAVGWFMHGTKPGETGNAVLAGHLDTMKSTAVFWNLKKLQIGDEIIITDENDEKIQFKVTKLQSYPIESAPTEEIFGSTKAFNLNLITCDGIWNWQKHTYSKRLIVFTEKV